MRHKFSSVCEIVSKSNSHIFKVICTNQYDISLTFPIFFQIIIRFNCRIQISKSHNFQIALIFLILIDEWKNQNIVHLEVYRNNFRIYTTKQLQNSSAIFKVNQSLFQRLKVLVWKT